MTPSKWKRSKLDSEIDPKDDGDDEQPIPAGVDVLEIVHPERPLPQRYASVSKLHPEGFFISRKRAPEFVVQRILDAGDVDEYVRGHPGNNHEEPEETDDECRRVFEDDDDEFLPPPKKKRQILKVSNNDDAAIKKEDTATSSDAPATSSP